MEERKCSETARELPPSSHREACLAQGFVLAFLIPGARTCAASLWRGQTELLVWTLLSGSGRPAALGSQEEGTARHLPGGGLEVQGHSAWSVSSGHAEHWAGPGHSAPQTP